MDLADYRNKIDEIDKEIVSLFERRMETSEAIANYKKDNNLPILNSGREDQVIKKVKSCLKNPELMEGAEELYRCIMKISRAYQQKKISAFNTLNIVYQGVPGAYSDIALSEFFGENFENGINKINVKTWQDVFTYLEDEKINYGVLPIENSSTGGIAEVYDLLRNGNYYIAGEKKVKVSHYLLGIKGAKIEDIKYVYSHPQALLQCEKFLNNFPNWSIIPYNNTAASVKLIKEKKDKSFAAIGSIEAKNIYDLDILSPNINFNKNNYTRFIIISKDEPSKSGDKISLVLSIKNESGALFNVLKIFNRNNINMVKIESRPIIGKPWEYFFYIDFEGNINQDIIKLSIEEIKKESSYFKLLGNYKADNS